MIAVRTVKKFQMNLRERQNHSQYPELLLLYGNEIWDNNVLYYMYIHVYLLPEKLLK